MDTPGQIELPDKLYFRVGEVSKIVGVPAYVLRFWETQFTKIRPKRTPASQRLYRKKDVELVLTIKHLLYDKKFTIEGAKQHLKSIAVERKAGSSTITMDEIRSELISIRDIIDEI
jgi:DNA-binding transcriptional MerR regulator